MILKNTYGLTTILSEKSIKRRTTVNNFAGSSLNRKRKLKTITIEEMYRGEIATDIAPIDIVCEEIVEKPLEAKKKPLKQQGKLRSMSGRTKQKIKKKVIAFSQVYQKLTFVTLTFVNKVTDQQAVKLLAKFLDNSTKQMQDFQYLWVAERQTKNKTFEGNIHFHIITNKYFKIDKYWQYWLKVQEKANIIPRDTNFSPSSAFDVRRINANNIKGLGLYITKYVTKNKDEFDCQVWNCSKKVSMLYTDFYTGYEFIENVEKVLDCDLESIPAEYCTIYPVPLNRKTLPMYERLNRKNRQMLKK